MIQPIEPVPEPEVRTVDTKSSATILFGESNLTRSEALASEMQNLLGPAPGFGRTEPSPNCWQAEVKVNGVTLAGPVYVEAADGDALWNRITSDFSDWGGDDPGDRFDARLWRG